MTAILRLFLCLCAGMVLLVVVRQVRKAHFNTEDSLFWLILVLGLVVVAVFPETAYFFSNLLGFQSPSNFVFLVVIALLLGRVFSLQTELVALKRKVNTLIQEIALQSNMENK